jgi:ribose 1,5-bisphosphate isomerase
MDPFEIIKKTEYRIKSMEIQGATNVAINAIKALTEAILHVKDPTRSRISEFLDETIMILVSSRETEPMMRNGLKYLENTIKESNWNNSAELHNISRGAATHIFSIFKKAQAKIYEVGSRRIHEKCVILSHCHSSSVTGIMLEAKRQGKEFEVIQTETRPRYQGRITAIELLEAGINTTMIVDSAARNFMKKADLVLVGSDAITSEGNVVNKIGTSQIALAAMEARIPFYIASTLLKFNPVTIHGEYETIEERDPSEVWVDPPTGLKIHNPAFDITRRDHIHGLISEVGIISPHSIYEATRRQYPWILY